MTHLTRTRRTAPRTDAPPPATATAAEVSPEAAEFPKTEFPKTEPPKTEFPKSEFPKHEAYAVLDALSDVVCVTTLDGTLQFLNCAGRDLLGCVDDGRALVGCLFPVHTPAARALMLDEVVPAALRLGQTTCDTALQTADGRIFPARQTVIATPARGDLPPTLTIVFRDVSIERQTADRLGESQRLFEMVARGSPDLMYLYDPIDERVVWMSRCATAFLGGSELDARTLSRKEIHGLIHPDDRATVRDKAARMAAAYSDSDLLTTELRMRTPGGSWRWIHTRISVFSRRETGAPLLMLGVATEITTRKKAEQRLLAERDAAEQASRTRGEFVARMTGEFRAALHAMVGHASEVRLDRDRRLTARDRMHLDETIARGFRLLETVSDLHDFSAIECGELAVEQSLIDVGQLIRESVVAFADHPAIVDTPLRVCVPDTAVALLTDPVRLRQALTHLLANALSCSRRGPITITLTVDDAGQTPLAIDVHDAGPRIDAEQERRLFAPFESAAADAEWTAHRSTGTGLGLALSRALCEMIGCSLSVVRAETGPGETFRISLPIPSGAAQLAAAYPTATSA